MSNLIRMNSALVKANAAIQVANKLLSINKTLPLLIPYRKGDKWGYCDKKKGIIIDCMYDGASPFFNGRACVKINDKVGVIDREGNEIIPCRFDEAVFSVQHKELVRVRSNEKWGFFDLTGRQIAPCEYYFYNHNIRTALSLEHPYINSRAYYNHFLLSSL